METALPIAFAYLLGSLPFGAIVARARGVDLRRVGSGNVGATNVFRALGLKAALVVFILDVAKGFAGTRLAPALLGGAMPVEYMRLACGLAVMAGSVASVFLGFRGGKGVAAAVGVFMGLEPLATAICLGIWIVLFWRFRYVSLGSVIGAAALPLLMLAINGGGFARSPIFILGVVVAAIVVLRHRSNIRRLLEGTENRMGGRP
jgi:glycerol-3-phosphate acyltransferase PlsY